MKNIWKAFGIALAVCICFAGCSNAQSGTDTSVAQSTTATTTTALTAEQKENLEKIEPYCDNNYKTNVRGSGAVKYNNNLYYCDSVLDDEFTGCIYLLANGSREAVKFIDEVCAFQMLVYDHYLFYVDEEVWGIYMIDLDNPQQPELISKDKVALVDSTTSTVCEAMYLKDDKIVYLANEDGYPTAYCDENYVYEYSISDGTTKKIATLDEGEHYISNYGYYATCQYDDDKGTINYYSADNKCVKSVEFERDESEFYVYPTEKIYEDDDYIILEETVINKTDEYTDMDFERTVYNKHNGDAQKIDSSSAACIVDKKLYTSEYDIPSDYDPDGDEYQIVTIKTITSNIKI